MGEIAEAMLDGTLCECCGVFIDDDDAGGFPRYCSPQCARDRGVMPEKTNIAYGPTTSISQPIAAKLVKTLKSLSLFGMDDAATGNVGSGQSLYAGMSWKMASAQFEKLRKRGFVERRTPWNPAHDDKAVITPAGVKFLIEIGAVQPPLSETPKKKKKTRKAQADAGKS